MIKGNSWLHLRKNANGHFLNPENHNQTPLSLLLIFADEVSVWQRCRLEAKLGKDSRSISYYFKENEIKEIVVELQNSSSSPSITIKRSENNIKEIEDALNRVKCFKSEQNGESMLVGYKVNFVD